MRNGVSANAAVAVQTPGPLLPTDRRSGSASEMEMVWAVDVGEVQSSKIALGG